MNALYFQTDLAAAQGETPVGESPLGDEMPVGEDDPAGTVRREVQRYLEQAVAQLELDNMAEALANFNKAILLAPDHAEAYLQRGIAYLVWVDYQKAIEDFSRVIELDTTQVSQETIAAYLRRGLTFLLAGEHDSAIQDWLLYLKHVPEDGEIHYRLGLAYLAAGETTLASACFTQAIGQDSNLVGAYSERGSLYFEKGDYAQALADFNKAVELAPGDASLYINRGKVQMRMGNFRAALADFDEVIRLAPDYGEARMLLGKIHLSQADYEGAIKEFSQLISMGPGDETDLLIESYLRRGLAYFLMGNYQAAIADWLTYSAHVPEDGQGYYRLSMAYSFAGKDDLALKYLNQAMQKDSTLVQPFSERARLRAEQGDHAGALQDYNRAVELAPREALFYFNRGLVQLALGNPDAALSDFNTVARLAPDFKEAYLQRANIYFSRADYAAAIVELTRFINMTPDKTSALVIDSYRRRGLAHFLTEEYDQAEGDWLLYLEHVPEDGEIHYLLGTVFAASGRETEALQSFSMALQTDGKTTEAYSERSRLLFQMGDFAGALQDLNHAVKLAPAEPQLYLNRGKVQLALDQNREALADFGKVISLSSDYLEAYLHRGNLYLSLSEYENAVRDYSRIIGADAQSEMAIECYRRRGLAYYFLNKNEAAIADWETYLKNVPRDVETNYRVGLAFFGLENFILSIEYFTKTVTLDNRHGDAYYQRANAYSLLNRYQEAAEDYTRAIGLLQTGLDTVYFNRGVAYINLEKWGLASADFEKVLIITANDTLAQDAGNILAQLKNQ